MSGWIRLDRSFVNHWLASRDDYAMAWIKLLLSASYETNKVLVENSLIELKAGELLASERFLCTKLNWTRDKVRSFLTLLETENMISRVYNHKISIVKIINWEEYQSVRSEHPPQNNHKPPAEQPQSNRRATKLNNNNNINNLTNKQTTPLPPKGDLSLSNSELICIGSHFKARDPVIQQLQHEDGKEFFNSLVEDINDYCASKGKHYRDYAATYRTWRKRKAVPEKKIIEIKKPPSNAEKMKQAILKRRAQEANTYDNRTNGNIPTQTSGFIPEIRDNGRRDDTSVGRTVSIGRSGSDE